MEKRPIKVPGEMTSYRYGAGKTGRSVPVNKMAIQSTIGKIPVGDIPGNESACHRCTVHHVLTS
jgi:hypothetical protein